MARCFYFCNIFLPNIFDCLTANVLNVTVGQVEIEALIYFRTLLVIIFISGHDPLNLKVITLFTPGKTGRLVGKGIRVGEIYNITTKEECAAKCNGLNVTKCLSFNYDFGPSGHCELLEAIEGHDHKISHVRIKWSLTCILVYDTEGQ